MRVAMFFLMVTLAACGIPKAEYDALQEQYDAMAEKNASLKQRNQNLKAKVDEAAEAEARRDARAAARLERLKELFREFKPAVERGVLEVNVYDGRVSIGLDSDVLFPPGSAELSKDGKLEVAKVARILERRSERHFQVEGHTDGDPISSRDFPSNWHLGAARAITVVQKMVKAGFPAERISAASFGETKPVASNDSKEGKALNRRIEIVLLPDLSELPGFNKLNEAYNEEMKGRKGRRGNKRKGK